MGQMESSASTTRRRKVARMLSPCKNPTMQNTKTGFAFKILLLVCFCSPSANAQTTRPDTEKQLAQDMYKQFIEIQSGFTTGATTPVAEAAAARLKAAGFPDTDIFVGGAIPKKANLVVRYHGTGASKPILLLAHTDVVEAKREDWSMDPFQFNESDGFFYGRGTGDDKAQAAVWIANLIQYKREGFKPDRDIIVALTADEEGGGPYNGVDWLLKNHRDLIDAELALNEGGWGEESKGKKISNDVQVSEKYVLNFRFEVRNKGGHSSMPVRDNAIYHLAGALAASRRLRFSSENERSHRCLFSADGKDRNWPHQGRSRKDRLRFAGSHGASRCCISRLEFHSPHHLRRHHVGRRPRHQRLATARRRHRKLPRPAGGLPEYVLSTLQKVVADEQVSVKQLSDFGKAIASPMRPDVLKAVSEITTRMWPGVPTVPIMVMGATDGRYLRAAGIPTYGIQGFFMDRDDIRFHGRDERLGVESFFEGQAFLYELVKRLSSAGK